MGEDNFKGIEKAWANLSASVTDKSDELNLNLSVIPQAIALYNTNVLVHLRSGTPINAEAVRSMRNAMLQIQQIMSNDDEWSLLGVPKT